jgi:hypothetical protein
MPFRILSRPTSIRRCLVSSFLADVTQHIHSLRANGVMLAHTPATMGSDSIASRKSAGILCTVPEAIGCRAMVPRVYRSSTVPEIGRVGLAKSMLKVCRAFRRLCSARSPRLRRGLPQPPAGAALDALQVVSSVLTQARRDLCVVGPYQPSERSQRTPSTAITPSRRPSALQQ